MLTLQNTKASPQAIGNWGNVMQLRPYQQDAVDAAVSWMKKCKSPAVLELATGAGKSWIAAAIAKWFIENAQKKVLILQPSLELTEQNYSKWIATGEKASIFSASANSKCTRTMLFMAHLKLY
jgi:DNA repair protein RadD